MCVVTYETLSIYKLCSSSKCLSAAVCVLFLLKPKWPKSKNLYVLFMTVYSHRQREKLPDFNALPVNMH